MRQPTIMELISKIENKELNNETKESIKNKVIIEMKENNNKLNKEMYNERVEEIVINNIKYTPWLVEFIKPFIIKYLKTKLPSSLIAREINDIDLTVFCYDKIIPVEIQKTQTRKGSFGHATFEDRTRRQIEDNIKNYGICWLFFDFEYLRYLQSKNIAKNININLTWMIDLIKDSTLNVFVIKYDGTVKELTLDDFDFLKNIYNDDAKELNRNKLKIYQNVIGGYNFTQEEITQFESDFDNRPDKKDNMNSASFFRKNDNNNERCKLYGQILHILKNLKSVNECLCMNNHDTNSKWSMTFLGIIEIMGNYGYKNQLRFVDKFNICQYFPGYLKYEKIWLMYSNREMTYNMFVDLCIGRFINIKTLDNY